MASDTPQHFTHQAPAKPTAPTPRQHLPHTHPTLQDSPNHLPQSSASPPLPPPPTKTPSSPPTLPLRPSAALCGEYLFSRPTGFTLIELIVAGVVAALVAAAAAVGLSQSLRARTAVDAHAEAQRRADLAAEFLRRDLQGTLRDGDLFYVMLRITDRGDALRSQSEFDEILFFARSDRRVRSIDTQPESGEYEIQYRAAPGPSIGGEPLPGFSAPAQPRRRSRADAAALPIPTAHTLWRRADPMPDDVPEGGGVVEPVTEGITRLAITAFDGQRWQSEWDSDSDGLPHAVRIVIEARDDTARATATAIRTVAIDRVPVPFVTISGSDTTSGTGGTGAR
ncbi:MAG: type II secretion system protein GspJ [Phycisphaerales bacterium]